MRCKENTALVTKFLGRMSAGDMAGMFDMMADDATWWVAGKVEQFPIAGTKTKQEMAALLAGMGGLLKGPATIETHGMTAEGDK